MDKATVITELQRVAKMLDTDSLSRSVFQRHATISSAAVESTFGTWNEGIQAAGLTPLPQGGIPKDEQRRLERVADPPTAGSASARLSDDDLLEDLLRLSDELGRRPSGNQVSAKGKYDPKVYKKRWGSIAAAYKAAVKRFRESSVHQPM
jgi:hypothetical protein